MRSASTRTSNRIELQVDLNYEVAAPGADFVFNVHAARTPSQSLSGERLVLSPAVESQTHTDPATGNRYLRVHAAPGTLALSYAVTVDLTHRHCDPTQLGDRSRHPDGSSACRRQMRRHHAAISSASSWSYAFLTTP